MGGFFSKNNEGEGIAGHNIISNDPTNPCGTNYGGKEEGGSSDPPDTTGACCTVEEGKNKYSQITEENCRNNGGSWSEAGLLCKDANLSILCVSANVD